MEHLIDLTSNHQKIMYDNCCKKILGNKQMLSRIIKAFIREAKDLSTGDIEGLIGKVHIGDFLFYFKNKRPYSRNGIYYIVDILVNELRGLYSDKFKGNYHPHSFRHSIVTHLYNNGTTLLTIKEFLGHSTVMTTEIYATPDTDIMRKQILKKVQNIKAQSKYSYENKTDLENWLKENM